MEIVGLLFSLALHSTPASQVAPSYPIRVDADETQCQYLIQDMWMLDLARVESWMAELPDKGWQIDILWIEEEDKPCAEQARLAVQRAGFTSIVVRQQGDYRTPDGFVLPPRGP